VQPSPDLKKYFNKVSIKKMFNLDSRFSSLYILTETIFKGYFYDSPHTLYTLQVHKTKGYSSNKLKKICGILSTLAALTYRCSVGANQVERTKIRKKMSAKI
jgi:hypothetical protein